MTFMHKKQLDANTFGVVFYRYKASIGSSLWYRNPAGFGGEVNLSDAGESAGVGMKASVPSRSVAIWIVFRSRPRIEAAWASARRSSWSL